MEFFRIKRDIPFMRYALIFNVISLLTFLIAVGALLTKGLNFGVDFTGGTGMEGHYQQAPDVNGIREKMGKVGFADAAVQTFGTSPDVLIRLPIKPGVSSPQPSAKGLSELPKDRPDVEMPRVEFAGPRVGREPI